MKGLAAATAVAGLAPIGIARAAQTSFTARIERAPEVLDPAFRGGPAEGNILRAVFQRLVSISADTLQPELDAAQEIKQVSNTQIDFTLKPEQMFTGELSISLAQAGQHEIVEVLHELTCEVEHILALDGARRLPIARVPHPVRHTGTLKRIDRLF